MTTNEAIEFFNTLRSQTTQKSDLKIYDEFTQTLTRLHKKNLSKEDVMSIEVELDRLNLKSNSDHNIKYHKKALRTFKAFLTKEFSLISKGYYTAIGMSLGLCFGVAFGSVIQKSIGTSSGLVFGMLIGICIGRVMDSKAEKAGKVL